MPAVGEVKLPMVACGSAIEHSVCVVPGELSLLLGKDFFEKHVPDLSYSRRTLTMGGRTQKFEKSWNKHPCIDLRPEAFSALAKDQESAPASELPRSLRSRAAVKKRVRWRG